MILLATPLFPVMLRSSSIKEILIKWVKTWCTFFVPLTYHKICKVHSTYTIYCKLNEVSKYLHEKVQENFKEIVNICHIAKVKDKLKIVIHTEYQCMIWNYIELIDCYSKTIIDFVKLLDKMGFGIEFL